jgi:hypothetical protein
MNYKEWKKSLAGPKGKTLMTAQAMAKNNSRDRNQYKRYKRVLGKTGMPQSFDEFRDMKYIKPDEWEKLKELYRNKLNMSAHTDDSIHWPERNNAKRLTLDEYKELRDYALERGVRLDRFKHSDADIGLMREMIDVAGGMLRRFPELKGDGKKSFTIRLAAMSSDNFAEIIDSEPHVMKLNEAAFRDKAMLEKEYAKLADSGWFVKRTDYRSIIYHEFGHMYEQKYNIGSLKIMQEIYDGISKMDTAKKLRSTLSEYSGSPKGHEIISEMFSAYFSEVEKSNTVLTFMGRIGII